MIRQARTLFAAALVSLGVAACCVLPMVFLLLGVGGSWLAVFGQVAAASYIVLGLSSALILVAWVAAARRGSPASFRRWLIVSTMLACLAWLTVLNESRINDALMTLM